MCNSQCILCKLAIDRAIVYGGKCKCCLVVSQCFGSLSWLTLNFLVAQLPLGYARLSKPMLPWHTGTKMAVFYFVHVRIVSSVWIISLQ